MLGSAGRRRILFVSGKPGASDSSEKMTITRQGDVTTVKFESGESYEIVDAPFSHAAAEAAVALAIALNFYNNHATVDVDRADDLKG